MPGLLLWEQQRSEALYGGTLSAVSVPGRAQPIHCKARLDRGTKGGSEDTPDAKRPFNYTGEIRKPHFGGLGYTHGD